MQGELVPAYTVTRSSDPVPTGEAAAEVGSKWALANGLFIGKVRPLASCR